MSARVATVCRCRLDGRRLFFVWLGGTTAPDRVAATKSARIRGFVSELEARRFAKAASLHVEKKVVRYDFDRVASWCATATAKDVDCNFVNNAWNFFIDVRAVGACAAFDRADRKATKCYDKVFSGLNLPAITPEGKSYEPVWRRAEIKLMKDVLRAGLDNLRSRL
jgi:hypothetical protein